MLEDVLSLFSQFFPTLDNITAVKRITNLLGISFSKTQVDTFKQRCRPQVWIYLNTLSSGVIIFCKTFGERIFHIISMTNLILQYS